jgi:hypothetical protein
MNCRDFEQYLGVTPLPAEAQAHLASCESCRAIAQWFDGAGAAPVPFKIELPPVEAMRPLPSPWWIAGGVLAVGAAVVAVGVFRLGSAGWDALAVYQKISIFAGLTIASAAAALLLARQMFPTLAKRTSPAVCVAAALSAMTVGFLLLLPLEYDADGFVDFGLGCAMHGILYASATGVPVWILIRRGYFVQPAWAGALSGLVSGITALLVLEVYCPLIEGSHVLLWHVGVVAVAVALASGAAWLATRRNRA